MDLPIPKEKMMLETLLILRLRELTRNLSSKGAEEEPEIKKIITLRTTLENVGVADPYIGAPCDQSPYLQSLMRK